ncbi:MAG: hypothetical protein ACOCT0_05280, partial [Halobacteriota archaeon]
MTVVLSGVAADTTNVRPTPAVDEEGGFDYVPIPERSRDATVETESYGSWEVRDGVAADHVDVVRPRGDGSLVVRGDEVRGWPLHHDPNFEALTYGERRPAYTALLRELDPGDAVVFYTGLRSGGRRHRYVIG